MPVRALIPNVGPDMIPIVGLALISLVNLKYKVNTYTKIKRRIKVK